MRRAFDLGVTHFDLANNYGPPYGSAEETFGPAAARRTCGRTATSSSSRRRPATTCGPARTATWGSRKYLLASLDQSLARMGLDYVDIFYSHRFDPETPLEETMGALDTAVRQGKALYAGISSYSAGADARGRGDPARARHAAAHPPAVVLDAEPLDRARRCSTRSASSGVGCIAFTAARAGDADRQVPGRHPGGTRARVGPATSFSPELLTEDALAKIRRSERSPAARAADPRPDGARLALARTRA